MVKIMAQNKSSFHILSFWRWLFLGKNGHFVWERYGCTRSIAERLKKFTNSTSEKGGYRCILNGYLVIHALIGLALTLWVPISLKTAANAVLFPLVGIFIGLSFAWVGNATALLQSDEIRKMVKESAGGLSDYAYHYQLSILVLFLSLALWGAAGLEIGSALARPFHWFGKWLTYTMTSIAIRECWQVVLTAQLLLICQDYIRDSNDNADPEYDAASEKSTTRN